MTADRCERNQWTIALPVRRVHRHQWCTERPINNYLYLILPQGISNQELISVFSQSPTILN